MFGHGAISEVPFSTLPGAITPNPVVAATDIDGVGAGRRAKRKHRIPHAEFLKPALSEEMQVQLAAVEREIEDNARRIEEAKVLKTRDARQRELTAARIERDALMKRQAELAAFDEDESEVEMLLLYG